MEPRRLNKQDIELFNVAKDQLERTYHPERHQVAAAVRTASGAVHRGLHIGSRRVNVCAESSAIAQAQMAGDGQVRTIVAVCKDEGGRVVVTNPCGVCRELLAEYGPAAEVIVDLAGAVRKVDASALLPNPWMFPRENTWSIEDPTARED